MKVQKVKDFNKEWQGKSLVMKFNKNYGYVASQGRTAFWGRTEEEAIKRLEDELEATRNYYNTYYY